MEDKFDKYILQQKLMEVIENSTSVQEMANWCARFSKKYKGVIQETPQPPKEAKASQWKDLPIGTGQTYTNSQDSLMGQITITPNTIPHSYYYYGKKIYAYLDYSSSMLSDDVARDYTMNFAKVELLDKFKNDMLSKGVFKFDCKSEKQFTTFDTKHRVFMTIELDTLIKEVLNA